MVAGVILIVGIQQLVAGPDHQGRSQLERSPPGLLLPMAPGERLEAGADRGRREVSGEADRLRLDDLSGGSVLIQQHRKRELLVLDEGPGVAFPPGTYCGHDQIGIDEVLLPVADLTGPLATGQSAEVTQEQQHGRSLLPQIAQPVRLTVGIDQAGVGESRHIERHEGHRLAVTAWDVGHGSASSGAASLHLPETVVATYRPIGNMSSAARRRPM